MLAEAKDDVYQSQPDLKESDSCYLKSPFVSFLPHTTQYD